MDQGEGNIGLRFLHSGSFALHLAYTTATAGTSLEAQPRVVRWIDDV